MRIVLITHRFPPRFLGGANLYTYGMAKELQCQGHAVSVICVEDFEDDSVPPGAVRSSYEPYDDLAVHRLYFNWRLMPDPYLDRFITNPAIESATEELLARLRPDVVHVTALLYVGAGVLRAARQLNLPVVLTLTGRWLLCINQALLRPDGTLCPGRQSGLTCVHCVLGSTRVYRALAWWPDGIRANLVSATERVPLLRRWSDSFALMHAVERRNRVLPSILSSVHHILSPSHCFQSLYGESRIFGEREIVYSPYGHQVELAAQGRNKTPSRRLRFSYTGQNVPFKGIDHAIMAFRMLGDAPRAELNVYGDPDLNPAFMEHLRNLAAGHPQIHFRGRYERSEIGHVLANTDVVLVPTYGIDNAPLTIAEAFAALTPVVASDTCGVGECIRDGVDGLVFQRGQVADLARQMQRLLDEPDLLYHLRKGIQPVRTTADEAVALTSVYEKLMANR